MAARLKVPTIITSGDLLKNYAIYLLDQIQLSNLKKNRSHYSKRKEVNWNHGSTYIGAGW